MKKNKAIIEQPYQETRFNITLGGELFLLNFGTATFRRIASFRGTPIDPLQLLDQVAPIEAIPYLIWCAINPESRKWRSEDEFLDDYDDCEDTEAIAKVIPAYVSALGRFEKKLTPAIERMTQLKELAEKA